MWLWIAAGWGALSVALAAIHHRIRRGAPQLSPEVIAFLARLENVLAKQHPDVEYLGLLPGRFTCLLRVAGQETPVSLQELWRHAQAFPDAFEKTVGQLLLEVQEAGLHEVADHDFANAAPLLLPQVRGRKWLEEQGPFGDGALVHRPLNDDLVVVYAIDDPQSMVFVCKAHLRRWQKSEADLHNLALANLRRRSDALAVPAGSEPLLLRSGDGYDAARVLLLEETDGLLVAIPDRDVLWVGREQGQDLAKLMATTEEIARTAPHPVSASVYRVTDGRLDPLPR
jgi:uncharacterized protein YtpQ (UPF0354 family)